MYIYIIISSNLKIYHLYYFHRTKPQHASWSRLSRKKKKKNKKKKKKKKKKNGCFKPTQPT